MVRYVCVSRRTAPRVLLPLRCHRCVALQTTGVLQLAEVDGHHVHMQSESAEQIHDEESGHVDCVKGTERALEPPCRSDAPPLPPPTGAAVAQPGRPWVTELNFSKKWQFNSPHGAGELAVKPNHELVLKLSASVRADTPESWVTVVVRVGPPGQPPEAALAAPEAAPVAA
eukprot:SAG11_NODE_1255_length_5375_cov_2.966641_1_plen_170_part_10